jgi:endonuclease/exonuclease/phosphatase family metal-dependent hydrolase
VVSAELVVASWNILAAPWAAPVFYPPDMDPAVLDRATRRASVATALAELDADLVCLQETTPVDLAAIVTLLGDGVVVHSAPNAPELWATWSTPELPWEANGTAVLWRRDRFEDAVTGALSLSDDGNVATTFDARLVRSGTRVRAVSVHLDVDHADLRRAQLARACEHLAAAPEAVAPETTAPERVVDVVAGDCNENTDGTELETILAGHGFVDALTAVGNADPTHPVARPTDDYAPLARLDHVLVRGAVPVAGAVVDADVWEVDDPGARMVEGVRRTGSDHFAVVARVTLPA